MLIRRDLSAQVNNYALIGDFVLPVLMAMTLSLTPSIGFFYGPLVALTGTYYNVIYFCLAFIIIAILHSGFVVRRAQPVLTLVTWSALLMILVSMIINYRGDQADWIGYQRYFFLYCSILCLLCFGPDGKADE